MMMMIMMNLFYTIFFILCMYVVVNLYEPQ